MLDSIKTNLVRTIHRFASAVMVATREPVTAAPHRPAPPPPPPRAPLPTIPESMQRRLDEARARRLAPEVR